MVHTGRREPASDKALHALPRESGFLTAAPQRAVPQPRHPIAEQGQRRRVHGHSVVTQMPAHHRAQPPSHLWNRIVQTAPKLGFHLPQFRLQPLTHRLPEHREPSVASLRPADVREPEKGERFRLALPSSPAVLGRKRPELDQPRLGRVQLQGKRAEPLGQLRPEPLGIRPVLESSDDVVRVAHDDHVAARLRPPPLLDHRSNA